MSRYARKKEDYQSKSNKIIPFPVNITASQTETEIDSLIFDALTNPEIEKHLKTIVEAAVIEAWMKTRLFDIERADDPFDAIYISELRADPLVAADAEQVRRYKDIIDLSNTIIFEDEWEDSYVPPR
jgi:hypothetical protein